MYQRRFNTLLILTLLSPISSLALADTLPSSQEIDKLNGALTSLGCQGGHMEKEENGYYEVEDTQCPDGKYDIEFDANLAVKEKEQD